MAHIAELNAPVPKFFFELVGNLFFSTFLDQIQL